MSGSAANYYGHNAIVRTKAFADCAGLPHLSGDPPFGGVIMSHDFVEAALLRRAGWSVRFMPNVKGSFEEAPETLTAHLARDRRWCHGCLQHLALLGVPGLAVTSRFHLLHGAMTYLCAPLWLAAVGMWTMIAGPPLSGVWLFPLLVIALVLLLPRVCGLLSSANSLTARNLAFAAQELVLSSLLAPTLMVQRTRMILSLVAGRPSAWEKPKNHRMSLAAATEFHAIEIGLALVMLTVWLAGQASSLIFAAAAPLLLAPLLNQAVSRRHTRQVWSLPHDEH
jgi:membrane glycosyltransferase